MWTSLVLVALLAGASSETAGGMGVPIFGDGFEGGDACSWTTESGCLDDDFEDGVLTGWNLYRPQDASVVETGGVLRIEPVANTVWFQGSTSIFVWKEVTGDFKVTSHVVVRRLPPNEGSPPLVAFRLGGIMARDGASVSGEDYVFIVLGADDDAVSVEAKTTDDSQSTYDGTPVVAGGEADLRLCRIGSEFRYYYREPAGVWQAHSVIPSVMRPDLPAVLQVGPVAYANNASPDLRVAYESVDFSAISSFAECLQ